MAAIPVQSPSMPFELDVDKIKRLRTSAGLTQQEAADKAGMTVSRWNDIESGRRDNVTISTLSIVADVLRVSAKELLRRSRGD